MRRQFRHAETVALQAIHPQRGEIGRIPRGFDRFRHCEHIEMLADGDKRGDEHLIIRILVDAANELPVELQNVEVEVLEIAEGGVACTEIIHREGHPARLEICHEHLNKLWHQHRRRLGDFEDQAAGHVRHRC